jgi:hypothetical protein
MVGFYTGMKERQAEKAADRRKTYQLFQQYVSNARANGLELSEAGLTDFWNQNSGDRFTRNAMPSQQRLQSLVQNQNDHLAEQQAAKDLQSMRDQVEVDNIFTERLHSIFDSTPHVPNDNSVVMQAMTDLVAGNPILEASMGRVIGDGSRVGAMQLDYQNDQLANNWAKYEPLLKSGVIGVDDVYALNSSISPHAAKTLVDRHNEAYENKRTLFEQDQADRANTNFNNALTYSLSLAETDQSQLDLDKIGARYNLTPEQTEQLRAEYTPQAAVVIQQAHEKFNASVSQNLVAANAKDEESILQLRNRLNDNTDQFFAQFNESPSVRGALATIQNTYMLPIGGVGAPNSKIADYVRGKIQKNPEWQNQSQAEIANDIINWMGQNLNNMQTWSGYKSQLKVENYKRYGIERYTTDTFQSVWMPRIERLLARSESNMKNAVAMNDTVGLQEDKQALVVAAKDIIKEIDYRRQNLLASFGNSVNEGEARRLLDEAAAMVAASADMSEKYQIKEEAEATPQAAAPPSGSTPNQPASTGYWQSFGESAQQLQGKSIPEQAGHLTGGMYDIAVDGADWLGDSVMRLDEVPPAIVDAAKRFGKGFSGSDN